MGGRKEAAMKARIPAVILAAVALIATACSGSGGGNNPTNNGTGSSAGGSATNVGAPLPAEIKSRGKLAIGVKCDYPPFGSINEGGKNAGFEIDLAHKMAEYAFGDAGAVSFTCVTGENRVPYLTTKRIDLIMATMNYTPERAKTIDFTKPYFDSGVKLLVPKNSEVSDFADVAGKSVITIKGTTSSIWLSQCMKDVKQQLFEQTSEALAALRQKRGVAFAQDDTLLVDLADKNNDLSVAGDAKADSPWGMGVRKGDKAMLAWVNGALDTLQKQDYLWTAFQKAVPKKAIQQQFEKYVPRPGSALSYPTGDVITC
jgi:polar amino acid transport system substrate-binding protein